MTPITPERLTWKGFICDPYGDGWELNVCNRSIEVYRKRSWRGLWWRLQWFAQLVDGDQLTESKPIEIDSMESLAELVRVRKGEG